MIRFFKSPIMRIIKMPLASFLILGLLLTTLPVLAEDNSGDKVDLGSSGAKFLEFSSSVKASAMGDAFVAIPDLSGMLWNPAGLASLEYKEVSIMHSALYMENSNNVVTAVLPIQDKYALGINLLGFGTPEEPIYDWSGNETGETLVYKGSSGGLTGAMKFTDNLSAGANLKFVSETLYDTSETAFAFDMGGLLKIPLTTGLIQLGFSLNNMGGAIRQSDISGTGYKQELPQMIRGGAAYIYDKITLTAEANRNTVDKISNFNMGAEYLINGVFAPRIGFKTNGEKRERLGLGFGVIWKQFTFDYAFAANQALGNVHRFAMAVKFGMEKVQTVKKEKPVKEPKVAKAAPAEPVSLKRTGKTINIAVAELSGKNVSAMDAAIVSDFLRTELVKTRVFTVLDRQNMERVLAEQKFQMSGCTSDECAVRMGKILNVQGMIVGTFSKFLGTYYINASFVDVETGEIIAAEAVECSSGRELPIAAKEVADRFAQQLKK